MAEVEMTSGDGKARRPVRWIAAGLLLAVLVVAAAVSGSTPYLRVCSPSAGGEELCRPMGLTDPQVVAVLALVGLLLLPDLSKVKIGGVLEVERMIAETNRKVEVADAKIERVLQQVSATSSADSHSDSAATNSVIVVMASSLGLDENKMARKAKEGLGVD